MDPRVGGNGGGEGGEGALGGGRGGEPAGGDAVALGLGVVGDGGGEAGADKYRAVARERGVGAFLADVRGDDDGPRLGGAHRGAEGLRRLSLGGFSGEHRSRL